MQLDKFQKKRSELLELSHELGREDRSFAVLGEGNASARIDEETFIIKASGSRLGTLQEQDVIQCRMKMLLPLLDSGDLSDSEVETALMASRTDSASRKPSIETLFHVYLLSHPMAEFVAHTHPLAVNQVLCSPMARAFAERRLFPDQVVYCGMASVFVPYTDPGLPLAQAIRRRTNSFIKKYRDLPQTIFLENHGLVALGTTAQGVIATTLMAEKAARIFVGAAGLARPKFLSEEKVRRIARRSDEQYRRGLEKL